MRELVGISVASTACMTQPRCLICYKWEEKNRDMLQALKDTLAYWESTGFAECEEGCDCIVDAVRATIAHAEEAV